MEYDNTNRGVLFKNDRKTEDYHGDYTGSIDIDGVEYFLDAWVKESKTGKKFFSLKKGNEKRGKAPQQSAPKQEAPAFDDDLPF